MPRLREDVHRLARGAIGAADCDQAHVAIARLPSISAPGTIAAARMNFRFSRSSTIWYSSESSV